MDNEPDIYLAPQMTAVPAVAAESEGALDMMPGVGAIAVGATHVPGNQPGIAIAVKRADGTSLIGVTTGEHAAAFHRQLGRALKRLKAADFNKPPVGQ